MGAYRQAVNEEAMSERDSWLAVERLRALYRKFDREERAMADQVFGEWVLCEDENVRFDALTLIDDFKVTGAVSALEELAQRLASSTAPGAPFEVRKVHRIIGELSAAPKSPTERD